MAKTRISFIPEKQDRDAIRLIRDHQGMMYDSAAVRWALRKAAELLRREEMERKNGR